MARPLERFPDDDRRAPSDDVKAAHRAMWAAGDYPAVATAVIPELGEVVVEAAGVRAGDRVLDVACGSGNAAIPAAARGADVTAIDLTPELLEVGRRAADDAGVRIAWREADAEAIPFDDATFDATVSCVGVMFAPHHRTAADELVRVTRRGGTIAVLSWTPESLPGEMLGLLRPYLPPPPPGAESPSLWGTEPHVAELLGDRVTDVRTTVGAVTVDRFPDPRAFRSFFIENFGPAVVARRSVEGDRDREDALDRGLEELAGRHAGAGGSVMEWTYLLATARRA